MSVEFDVSIVLVVYRTPEFLERCLDTIARVAPKLTFEILVQDNDPLDDRSGNVCARWAEAHPYSIQYTHNEKNLGFARAVNQGITASRARAVLVLNPDVEVGPGSIEELYRYIQSEPDVGIVAPRLHYPDGELQLTCRTFYSLPIFLLRRTFLGKIFPKSRIIRDHLMLDWDHETTREVDWCIGGAVMAPRDAIEDVGPMDERFFLYFEDVDWCYRMHQRDWRVVYHPESRMVHHYQRASAGWKPSRGLMLHLASTVRFYEKWSFVLYWFKLRTPFLRRAAMFFVDLAMVVLAFVAAYYFRAVAAKFLVKPMFEFTYYLRFLFFTAVVSMGSFLVLGHYRERATISVLDNLLPVLRALLWTSVLMMASTFLFAERAYSRAVVGLFFPLAALLVTGGRVGLMRLVQSVKGRDLNLLRVGILGPDGGVEQMLDRFRRLGQFGMAPVPIPVDGLSGPDGLDARTLLRRLRAERVQEVVVFEDCPGDLPAILATLRNAGLPVRLVPQLRDALPSDGVMSDFMGYPAIQLGSGARSGNLNPGRRAFDVGAAVVWAVIGFIPFVILALGRLFRQRQVLESVSLRGQAGRRFRIQRIQLESGEEPPRGIWRSLLVHYPALSTILGGELSWIGIYPFPEGQWRGLDPSYRATPPDGIPGIIGPWTTRELVERELCEWSQGYLDHWSSANDFRIFWRALRGN